MRPIYEPKGAAKEYGDLALNIYTGCPHGCYYCVDENTPVLTATLRSVPIKDIEVGDIILGVRLDGKYHKMTASTVLNKFTSTKEAYRIRLGDGTEIVCSADHRWLTSHRGWKYTIGAMGGKNQRPYLTNTNKIVGYGKAVCTPTPAETDQYKQGYLYGIISGDGTIGHYEYEYGRIDSFRLAMKDKSAVERTADYLTHFGIETYSFAFKNPNGSKMPAIRAYGSKVKEIETLISPTEERTDNTEYLRGFMAGFYDAEGSSGEVHRACNTDEALLKLYEKALDTFNFSHKREQFNTGQNKNVMTVRVCGGFPEYVRFRQIANVAIYQKFSGKYGAIKSNINTQVVSIEKLNEKRKMMDITTTTGNFFANGCVAHNCFAPSVLRRDRDVFHTHVEPRANIVEEVRKQLEREHIHDKLIHLCFSCDPYPTGYDTTPTREIIKLLKDSGNHVQILTKGDGMRDFDLLDENDWFGVTYSGYVTGELFRPVGAEPGAISPADRLYELDMAHRAGIKTWISIEPVLNAVDILNFLSLRPDYIDKFKIGKLNYHPSDIDWKDFGERVERICISEKLDYYIKDSLRKEMN